jgi:hypothetical protein
MSLLGLSAAAVAGAYAMPDLVAAVQALQAATNVLMELSSRLQDSFGQV